METQVQRKIKWVGRYLWNKGRIDALAQVCQSFFLFNFLSSPQPFFYRLAFEISPLADPSLRKNFLSSPSLSFYNNMEQKIITSGSAHGLNEKIEKLISEGWKPLGSHQVVVKHSQNRFAGMQHKDTIHELEYSQTLIKDEKDN